MLWRPPGQPRSEEPGDEWARRPVLDAEPARLDGPSWLARGTLVPFAVLLAPIVVLAVRRRWPPVVVAALVAVVGCTGLLTLGGGLRFLGIDYATAGPLIAGLSVVVFLASVAPVWGSWATRLFRPGPRIPPPPPGWPVRGW